MISLFLGGSIVSKMQVGVLLKKTWCVPCPMSSSSDRHIPRSKAKVQHYSDSWNEQQHESWIILAAFFKLWQVFGIQVIYIFIYLYLS